MKDIAIYGFGGYSREVTCLINLINSARPQWNFIGYFDDVLASGMENNYGKILGNIEVLNNWGKDISIVIAIGNSELIETIAKSINNPKVSFPNIIVPSVTFLDPSAFTIGKGNIIGSNCRFSCNVSIGDFNIFNGDVVMGHDSSVGNYNILLPLTRLSGGAQIGNSNFFGIGSVVLQYVKIGMNTRICAGSFVMRKTKDNNTYMGNPATLLKCN